MKFSEEGVGGGLVLDGQKEDDKLAKVGYTKMFKQTQTGI